MSGFSNSNDLSQPTENSPEHQKTGPQSQNIDLVQIEKQNIELVLKNDQDSPGPDKNCQSDKIVIQLKEALSNLQVSFEEKIKYDLSKESQIDKLHSELQEHKNGLILKILKPLVLDLITLHDNTGKILLEYKKSSSSEVNLKLYESFQTDIEDILYRYGFESYASKEDVVEFDAKRQRIAKTLSTDDISRDRQIAERLRKGFTYEGNIIRPEMVSVYTFKLPPAV